MAGGALRSMARKPQSSRESGPFQCLFPPARALLSLGRLIGHVSTNRLGTDPYAGWCGRGKPRGFSLSRSRVKAKGRNPRYAAAKQTDPEGVVQILELFDPFRVGPIGAFRPGVPLVGLAPPQALMLVAFSDMKQHGVCYSLAETILRSSTNSSYCTARDSGSGARSIDDGCTVARVRGA